MKNPVEKKDPVKDKKSEYSDRVIRGGDWNGNPSYGWASGRSYRYPSYRSSYIGFRIVKNREKK